MFKIALAACVASFTMSAAQASVVMSGQYGKNSILTYSLPIVTGPATYIVSTDAPVAQIFVEFRTTYVYNEYQWDDAERTSSHYVGGNDYQTYSSATSDTSRLYYNPSLTAGRSGTYDTGWGEFGSYVDWAEYVDYGMLIIDPQPDYDYLVPGNYTVNVISAVPEPATWAMMIGGIGMIGGAMRRRRAVSTKVSFA